MKNIYLQLSKPSVFANSFLLFIGLLTSFFGVGQVTVTINTPGAGSWVVPCGVTEIQVQLWGAGGAGGGSTGNNKSGGGGGSGCYGFFTIPVTEGASISYTVGAGGAGVTGGTGQDGGSTVFGPHTVGGGFGGVVDDFTPGNGCSTGPVNGNPGIAGISSTGGNGGAAPNGGAGGTGTTTITGGSGDSPGGGGGGSHNKSGSTNGTGGAGGNGQIIIFYEAPFPAGLGQALATCETSTTLNALALPAGYAGTWSVSPAGPVIDFPSANNSSVSNLGLNEIYTFTWTVSNIGGGCPAVTSQVNAATQSMEVNAGFNQNFCQTVFVMNANPPIAPATGLWSVVSGSATITNPLSPTTTVTGLAQGACVVLRWTITDGPCVGYDEVILCRPAAVASCNDDPCYAVEIPINGCSPGSFAGSTVTQNPGQPGCGGYTFYGGDKIDVWFTATTDANGNLNLNLTGNQYLNAAIYTGTCSNLTQFSCHGWNNTTNPLFIQETNLPPNTVVYIRVWKLASPGGTFSICQTASTNLGDIQPGDNAVCGGTFFDSGGSGGNYGNNELTTWTICPDTPGEFVSVNFSMVDLEAGFDQLTIIDGDDASDPVLAVTAAVGTYTSSHASGCLTFIFRSDLNITRTGWSATVSCVANAATNTYPAVCNEQNCLGGCMRTLCGNPASVPFTGNGFGIQELTFGNNGCMDTGERCANWFFINPSSPGTLTMDMYVNNGQNQDFALWEGYAPSLACPSATGNQPILCNIAPSSNLGTGFNSSYSGFNTAYEDDLVITQQQIDDGIYFIMMVQTFSNGTSCPQPTVDITFDGTAGLSCDNPVDPPSTLDVSLLEFNALNKGRANYAYWLTSSERNNDFFTVQYSADGERWEDIAFIKGAGNSTQVNSYSFNHYDYAKGINYYRLKQTDYDGTTETFDIVSVDNRSDRYVIRTVNTLGQEVNDNFKGIIIDQYSDGSSEKRYNY